MKRLLLMLMLFCSAGSVGSSPSNGAENDADEILQVATRHVPPFAVKQPDGSWTGISVELWQSVSTQLGWRTEFVDMGLTEMLDAVAQGKVDAVAGALTITADREGVSCLPAPELVSIGFS